MRERLVHASGLVRHFGDLKAVDGLDLELLAGTCLGLLGPNGAGKTTTVEMIVGLSEPDAGVLEVFGGRWADEGPRLREGLGVQLQETQLPDKLRVVEVLELFRALYREGDTPEEVLDLVGLREKAKARVSNLSGGQKQRLALGCALIHEPRLLVLDEPTTGLDPQARRRVWEIIGRFKEKGGGVLLTTHYMDEAEQLADEVVIVDRGRAIERGTPEALIARLDAAAIVAWRHAEGGPEASAYADIPALGEVVREADGRLLAKPPSLKEGLEALFEHSERLGVAVEDLATHRPNLEDVFVALTGRQLRDG